MKTTVNKFITHIIYEKIKHKTWLGMLMLSSKRWQLLALVTGYKSLRCRCNNSRVLPQSQSIAYLLTNGSKTWYYEISKFNLVKIKMALSYEFHSYLFRYVQHIIALKRHFIKLKCGLFMVSMQFSITGGQTSLVKFKKDESMYTINNVNHVK